MRDRAKAQLVLPPEVELTVGDVTRPETLTAAIDGVDAIVFTHGSDGGGKASSQDVTASRRSLCDAGLLGVSQSKRCRA